MVYRDRRHSSRIEIGAGRRANKKAAEAAFLSAKSGTYADLAALFDAAALLAAALLVPAPLAAGAGAGLTDGGAGGLAA